MEALIDERIGTEQRNHQCFHAAVVVGVSLVCFLQGFGVAEGLVASQKEAEHVADKNLFAVRGVGQALDQLEWTIHLAVHPGHAGVYDLARDVDRFVQFVEPKAPVVIIQLERQTQRIHFAVTLVAFINTSNVHAFAKRPGRFIGQLGIHIDRNIWNVTAQKFITNPMTTPNRIIIKVSRVSHQPRRVG